MKKGRNFWGHVDGTGSIAVAGLAVRWLRDKFNVISDYEECATLAASVTGTAGVYFVPTFSGLCSPCKVFAVASTYRQLIILFLTLVRLERGR